MTQALKLRNQSDFVSAAGCKQIFYLLDIGGIVFCELRVGFILVAVINFTHNDIYFEPGQPWYDSDQLLKAVVSESDLHRDLRAHLKRCPACRQEVARLAARFGAIGKMARDISPDALGRVRLPDTRRRFFLGRRIGLRPALGMAVAMALLMMMALYQPFGNRPSPIPAVTQTAEPTLTPAAEDQLLAEFPQ